jgi:hypothetical protein
MVNMQFHLFLRWLVFFCCILSVRAEEIELQEENVIAAIDPATEVRLGTLQQNELIQKYHLSTNNEYIEAVNLVGQRIANSIYERPDLLRPCSGCPAAIRWLRRFGEPRPNTLKL